MVPEKNIGILVENALVIFHFQYPPTCENENRLFQIKSSGGNQILTPLPTFPCSLLPLAGNENVALQCL